MNNKSLVLASAILALGLILLGVFLRSGIVEYKRMDRTVVVKGLSEREVKADKVTWPLIYKEIGNDPSSMYELLESKNRKVLEFRRSVRRKQINDPRRLKDGYPALDRSDVFPNLIRNV